MEKSVVDSPAKLAEASDPRIFFAAERTLLAWLRSGIAVIGLGFLVARFGLFLRMVHAADKEMEASVSSSIIGIGMVLLGAIMIGGAALQHTRFCRILDSSQKPLGYWMSFAVLISGMIAVCGGALAIYLLVSMQ